MLLRTHNNNNNNNRRATFWTSENPNGQEKKESLGSLCLGWITINDLRLLLLLLLCPYEEACLEIESSANDAFLPSFSLLRLLSSSKQRLLSLLVVIRDYQSEAEATTAAAGKATIIIIIMIDWGFTFVFMTQRYREKKIYNVRNGENR